MCGKWRAVRLLSYVKLSREQHKARKPRRMTAMATAKLDTSAASVFAQGGRWSAADRDVCERRSRARLVGDDALVLADGGCAQRQWIGGATGERQRMLKQSQTDR